MAKPAESSDYGHRSWANQMLFDGFVDKLYVKNHVDSVFDQYVPSSFVTHDPNLPPNTTQQALPKKIFPGVDIHLQRTPQQGDYSFVFSIVEGAPAPDDTSEIMDLWWIHDGKMQEFWETLELLPMGFSV